MNELARLHRVYVWEDTVNKCTTGKFKNLPYGESKLFHTNDKEFDKITINKKFEKTEISVLNEDVLIVAEMLHNLGEKNILVLNLASWKKAGGGVIGGAMAQEEELFRRSNYFLSFDNRFHPLKKGESVYTQKVNIIKNSKYVDLDQPFEVSMLALPGISNPNLTLDNKFDHNDYKVACNIIENIFRVALLNYHEALVLGAIGCGVFKNPPEEIVKIFNIYLKKYNKCFKTIVFAVLSKSDQNFNIFNSQIQKVF